MSVFASSQPNLGYRYYVYALLCKDSGGAGYVKFGFTRRIDLRLSQIKTACPIPIRTIALLEVQCEDRQKRIEKALHNQFAERRLSGEWFSFDFSSTEDKKAFNEGCKRVFLAHVKNHDDQYWSTVDMRVLEALQKDGVSRFLKLPEKFKRLARERQKRNSAVTCR